MAVWSDLNLQESSSPLMEQLNFFHDHSMIILVLISITVSYMMITMCYNKIMNQFLIENQVMEMIWTIIPSIILIFIALPSLRILYLLDELMTPMLTVKTMGHQWYWSYEYSDFLDIEFDSYMISDSSMLNNFRVLEVDHRLLIPTKTQTRLLVSATDVLHSWAMPSLGVKIDANPGRINQTNFMINYTGVFYGQCSEICGAMHSFMPIVLESIPKFNFIKWLMNKYN